MWGVRLSGWGVAGRESLRNHTRILGVCPMFTNGSRKEVNLKFNELFSVFIFGLFLSFLCFFYLSLPITSSLNSERK